MVDAKAVRTRGHGETNLQAVHEVLRAKGPLPSADIVEEVLRREAWQSAAKDRKASIRSTISCAARGVGAAASLVRLGDGRYCLVSRMLARQLLTPPEATMTQDPTIVSPQELASSPVRPVGGHPSVRPTPSRPVGTGRSFVKDLLRLAVRDLGMALRPMWPTKEGSPEPEHNFVFWVGRRLADRGFLPVFEVNFLKEKNSRLDLVAVHREDSPSTVWLCEAKHLVHPIDAKKAAEDMSRLKSFRPDKHGLSSKDVRCLMLLSTRMEGDLRWWMSRGRESHPEDRRRHKAWGVLGKHLKVQGIEVDAIPGADLKVSMHMTVPRWVLFATWRRR